jgi:hypothetical protein
VVCELAKLTEVILRSFGEGRREHAFELCFGSERIFEKGQKIDVAGESILLAASSAQEVTEWIGIIVRSYKNMKAMQTFIKKTYVETKRAHPDLGPKEIRRLQRTLYQKLPPEQQKDFEKLAVEVRVKPKPKPCATPNPSSPTPSPHSGGDGGGGGGGDGEGGGDGDDEFLKSGDLRKSHPLRSKSRQSQQAITSPQAPVKASKSGERRRLLVASRTGSTSPSGSSQHTLPRSGSRSPSAYLADGTAQRFAFVNLHSRNNPDRAAGGGGEVEDGGDMEGYDFTSVFSSCAPSENTSRRGSKMGSAMEMVSRTHSTRNMTFGGEKELENEMLMEEEEVVQEVPLLDPDEEVEMRGRHHRSPLKISKKFMREEEKGYPWVHKRAAEVIYLEKCQESGVLPLSSCLQSVIRPQKYSVERYLGDAASRPTYTSAPPHPPHPPIYPTPSITVSPAPMGVDAGGELADKGKTSGGGGGGVEEREEEEREEEDEAQAVLISLRHYGMGSGGIGALLSWIGWRAGVADVEAEGDGQGDTDTGATAARGSKRAENVRLDLSGNNMRGHDSERLMAQLAVCLYLPPTARGGSITELDLSRNEVGHHLHLLFPPHVELMPSTDFLGIGLLPQHHLVCLRLSDVGLSDFCAPALANAISQSHALVELDVSHNRLASSSAHTIAHVIAQRFKESSAPNSTQQPLKLASMNLSWNSLEGSSRGVAALCDALGSGAAGYLTSLDLSWNALREKGVIVLGQALRRNERQASLKNINLSHCLVPEAACVLLATALTHNTQLTALHMSGNAIGFHGARALFRLLLLRPPFFLPNTHAHGGGGGGGGVGGDEEALWISRRGCSLKASTTLP